MDTRRRGGKTEVCEARPNEFEQEVRFSIYKLEHVSRLAATGMCRCTDLQGELLEELQGEGVGRTGPLLKADMTETPQDSPR